MADVPRTTADKAMLTPMKLRFMCEQLREWGGLSDAEVEVIYKRELDAMESPQNG